jgi:hypothetical protein
MKDFYKQMKVPDDASDARIRSGLPFLEAVTRASAEMVLLDPRRRAVYDRNRRLLVTIAQLRVGLNLNYTRFWARREFKDFWPEPVFVSPTPQAAPKRRVNKEMIAQAFHTVGHHSRRQVARWGGWWVMGWIAVTAILTFTLLWWQRIW